MIRRNSLKLGSGSSQKITVRLLDDNEVIQVDFQSHHKGQFLMDYICRQLNIAEKDYFGLRFVDSNKQRHWLDLGKSILKQLKEMTPYIVCVRFKFYPCDPLLLKEEVTRYQLVLQLRRDILHGRLYSNLTDMAGLACYIIQSELGDYDPEIHRGNYVAEFELTSRQTAELEEKVIELHQKLKGMTPNESDQQFLKKAASLDTYGVDPHPVKDQQGDQLYLGINHTGISTFQGSKKSTHFKWSQITKLNYEAKMFIVHLSISEDSRTKKKETVGFKCQTSSSCKYLWRCAVEQRVFYNGSATNVPSTVRGGGIFGTRFRYSGRIQKEILEDPGPLRASDLTIQRTPLYRSLQRNKTRSLPHSPLQLGYGSLPRSNHSAPPHESTRLEGALGTLGSSTSLPLSTLSSPYCPDHPLPLLETLPEDSPRGEEPEENCHEAHLENITEEPNVIVTEESPAAQPPSPTPSELFVLTTEPEVPISVSSHSTGGLSPILGSIEEETESSSVESEAETPTVVEVTPPPLLVKARRTGVVEQGQIQVRPTSLPNGLLKTAKAQLVKMPAIDLDLETAPAIQASEKVEDESDKSRQRHSEPISYGPEPWASTLDSNANSLDLDKKLTAEKLTATISSLTNPESVSKTAAFLPNYHGDTEDGYEVVPDPDGLLRESRIDQIQTPVVPMTKGPITVIQGRKSSPAFPTIGKIFIVCLVCVLIALVSVAIIAIEVDVDICRRMRKIPEIELFHHELYQPVKGFLWRKFHPLSQVVRHVFAALSGAGK